MILQTSLRVVIQQEALHNQDVDLLVGVGHIRGSGQSDAMGTGEFHWVFNPAFYCAGHGLHIQSCDH